MKNTITYTETKLGLFFLIYLNFKNIFIRNNSRFDSKIESVNGFNLEKIISSNGVVKPYKIGIYSNKLKQKYIGKIWSGLRFNYDYYSLLHEANLYKILNKFSLKSNSNNF